MRRARAIAAASTARACAAGLRRRSDVPPAPTTKLVAERLRRRRVRRGRPARRRRGAAPASNTDRTRRGILGRWLRRRRARWRALDEYLSSTSSPNEGELAQDADDEAKAAATAARQPLAVLQAEAERMCAPVDRAAPRRVADATAALLIARPTRCSTAYDAAQAARGAARLRRPGPEAARPAAPAGRRALGAVQARRRPRPHPDRRGAGHQPRAMGRSSQRWPRNSSPATARATQIAHGLRGRRREAVDLQLPARRPGRVRAPCAAISQPRVRAAEQAAGAGARWTSRSARPRPCWTRSTRSSPRRGARRRRARRHGRSAMSRRAGAGRAGRALAAGRRPTRRRSRRAWAAAADAPRAAARRAPGSPRAIADDDRAAGSSAASGRAARPRDPRRRRHGAGAPPHRLRRRPVRALKQRGVPVAGADRLVLTEQLAVQDLMALGRFLLLPEDDLTLATRAESPLFGLTEEQLFDLAHDRGQAALWTRCASRAAAEHDIAARLRRSAPAAGRGDFVPPFELFAGVLNAPARDEVARRRAILAGSAPTPPTRSTSFSRLRSPTSAAMRPRCKAFCTGSRRRDRDQARSRPGQRRRSAS